MATEKYNFKKIEINSTLHKYFDKEGVVVLYIFNSGWKNKYHCIKEWGEYGTSDYNLFSSEEINNFYGIDTFLRKDKLVKINESTL